MNKVGGGGDAAESPKFVSAKFDFSKRRVSKAMAWRDLEAYFFGDAAGTWSASTVERFVGLITSQLIEPDNASDLRGTLLAEVEAVALVVEAGDATIFSTCHASSS